jgi:hypothetical protein
MESSGSGTGLPAPSLLGHIVPVLVGVVVALVLTLVTSGMLAANGTLPPADVAARNTRALLIVTLYRALFAIVGSHLAARLAPTGNPRIPYALAVGMVLLALNAVGAVTTRGQVPLWYSLTAIALTVPCAILGGATAVRAMEKRK